MKFGGTSVGSADRIRAVAGLVAARKRTGENVHVVVSAMAGVTNDLLRAAQLAAAGDSSAEELVASMRMRHMQVAEAVALHSELEPLRKTVQIVCDDLHSLLRGISLVRDVSPRVLDAVAANGEILSSHLVAAAVRAIGVEAIAVDAREFILTDDTFGGAVVDRPTTFENVKRRLASESAVAVITGFIAKSTDGSTTTLGRGGSDYTASLIGAAVDAGEIEIWTDVNGVMSADPHIVGQAFSIQSMTYTELMELSHFGARVIYPPSVVPARDARIPLVIRNTMNPEFPGTRVVAEEVGADLRKTPRFAVRGISSINTVALCRLEGAGMLGVAGIATRLFGALARDGISVILISQASSEHSICFALEPHAAARARKRVDAEFELERRAGAVEPLFVEQGYSVLAAVGEAMRETPGIAGRLFDVLGRNGINVRAIAQGSSELNISLVVPQRDEARALRLVHDAFFFPRIRTVEVFIAGTGRVGAALLDQLSAESPRLPDRVGVRVVVTGIARSRFAVIDRDGVDLDHWSSALEQASGTPASELIDEAVRSPNAHKVFVDCTANPEVAAAYEKLLLNGVAIVSANKIALSASMDSYRRLRELGRLSNGIYTETTVGAGLPVLRPISDLVATGDVVTRIEGVLSGTLSFLFGRIMAGAKFSEAVIEAHRLGFTEPDPRDDLNGRDVARKLLILGREAGFEIEAAQISVTGVLGGERWERLSIEEFWRELPSVDEEFQARRSEAIAKSGTLSYVGSIHAGGSEVGLKVLDRAHACAALSPGDNLIAVTSARYRERPLIISGPGAGPAVTAAGVFADILRAANESR